jgi:hypothetical protein
MGQSFLTGSSGPGSGGAFNVKFGIMERRDVFVGNLIGAEADIVAIGSAGTAQDLLATRSWESVGV